MPERETALKLAIKDITSGEPRRVRVLATVVSRFVREDGKYAVLTLDDATDTITARAFNGDVPVLERISEGDIVDVIGMVSEYQDELYISAESAARITDPNWELVRKLELARDAGEPAQEEIVGGNKKTEVKKVIEELDEGDGVKYLHIIEACGVGEEELDRIITELMESGEVYEPKIGKFKRV